MTAPQAESIVAALDGTSRDLLTVMRSALAAKLDAGEIAGNSISAAYRELRELDRLVRLDIEDREESATSDRLELPRIEERSQWRK